MRKLFLGFLIVLSSCVTPPQKQDDISKAIVEQQNQQTTISHDEKLNRECNNGNAVSCIKLSSESFEIKDLYSSKIYAEKACDLNNGAGCALVATFYYGDDSGIKNDYVLAKLYLEKSCILGSGLGCLYLGEKYQKGDIGLTKNFFDAKDYYEKACQFGAGKGCLKLGLLYLNGEGVRQSKSDALKYMFKGCNLKDGDSCAGVGITYQHGEAGLRKDLLKAKQYYGIGCDLKSDIACKSYADINSAAHIKTF